MTYSQKKTTNWYSSSISKTKLGGIELLDEHPNSYNTNVVPERYNIKQDLQVYKEKDF